MKYLLILLLLASCAAKESHLTEQQVKTDTISTSLEPMADLKADRTEEVKGYWKKNGNDSVYVKPYKRKPRQ